MDRSSNIIKSRQGIDTWSKEGWVVIRIMSDGSGEELNRFITKKNAGTTWVVPA